MHRHSTGTFEPGYGGSGNYVFFYGDTGRTVSYRWAGPVRAPTTMTTVGLSGLAMDKGSEFVLSRGSAVAPAKVAVVHRQPG